MSCGVLIFLNFFVEIDFIFQYLLEGILEFQLFLTMKLLVKWTFLDLCTVATELVFGVEV